MQEDDLIRERYLLEDELDGKTGLLRSPENDIIHTYLEDRARKPRFKSQTWQEERDVTICKRLAVKLEVDLQYMPVTLVSIRFNHWQDGLQSAVASCLILSLSACNPEFTPKKKAWTHSLQKKLYVSPLQIYASVI